jgi:hypothetical protein
VYLIKQFNGLSLFSEENQQSDSQGGDSNDDTSAACIITNGIYLVIDPILRHFIAIKYDYKPYWL